LSFTSRTSREQSSSTLDSVSSSCGELKKTTKCGFGVEIIIPVDRVERFYNSVRKFAKIVQPLEQKKWGRRDFRIADPFGFYLRITERYEWVGKLEARQKKLIDDYKTKLKEVALRNRERRRS